MELSNILNAKALEYAELILSELPPKQAEIHGERIRKYCDLLLRDAGATARFELIEEGMQYLRKSASEIEIIISLANNKFFKTPCDPLPLMPYQTVEIRDEIDYAPLTEGGKMLAEIAFRFIEQQQKETIDALVAEANASGG